MNLNKVFLIGRLTQDPQSRALPSGTEIAHFSLATDRYFVEKTGQKRQETNFHNIVLFGNLARIACRFLKKGSLALIEGRINTRTWKDNEGKNRSRTEIVGERLQLGPKPQNKTAEVKKEEEIPIVEESAGGINLEDIPF